MVKRQVDPVAWLHENLNVSDPAADGMMEIAITGKAGQRRQLVQIVDAIVAAYMREIVGADPSPNARSIAVVKDAGQR
jgi:hypothetical protein